MTLKILQPTRTPKEIFQPGITYSKLTIETLGASIETRCQVRSKLNKDIDARCRSGVFIVNFEHISALVLVFLLLTLNM